uniref:Peroxin/Ferlin domain-containing protein n=1 Tax=Caenorhabditis japonica TaxID=281687 RepID=A0A8R1I9M5_CAEJA
MPAEYIWIVSENGVPCRIPAVQDPRCTSEVDWQEVPCSDGSSILTIVSSATSAFAIDKTGRALVLVLPTHIAIRERVEIYANQRWYLFRWANTLFLDRPRFSDETGRIPIDPSYNEVEPGWSWEEPWSTHFDPRKFDSEGWQYSHFFLSGKWEKKCGSFHYVRRKIFKRHMRYTAHDQWIEMSSEDGMMFTELAIGGMDVMEEGESLLFAIGTDGNVYRREDIQTNQPSGSDWDKLPKIKLKGFDADEVILIAVSPSLATLLCITWDGKMFSRRGISRRTPSGVTWQNIPTPRNKAVICASIGTRTLWCITADGSVWFTRVQVGEKRKEHLLESISASGYQLVTQGGICKVTVTKNDQVFCISTSGKIEVRTGIEKEEPSGKRFEKIIDRGEIVDQKWISINAGAVTFSQIPEFFMSSTSLQSKFEILERLQEASDRSWTAMKNIKGAEIELENDADQNMDNIKLIRCQFKIGDGFRSVNVWINDTHMEISADEKFTKKQIEVCAIKSVLPSFQRLPQKYLLKIFTGGESECFAFTDEKSRGSFHACLESIIRDHILSSTRSSFGESMWSVSCEGIVRWHCFAEMSKESGYEKRVNPGVSRGLTIDGHFESIDCGAKRAVWAMNGTGSLYSLSSKFDPLDSHETYFDFKMVDQVTLRMFEYQKTAIFRGFITFQGVQKGISAWMCDGKPCPPSFSSLPSTNWSWIDAKWQLEDDKWEYSNEIDGVYVASEKEQGRARRRSWFRRARFESNKTPWCHVEAPSIQCIRVAKTESLDGTIAVVALTKDGHILKRTGVDREKFTGQNWQQILVDFPIACIHLEWEEEMIWCVTTDGLTMLKHLESTEDWEHLDMDVTSITRHFTSKNSFDLTGYSGILFARINNIIFRIDTTEETISDAYPMDNLQQAVVDRRGSICIRGANITVVREWRVFSYTDRKATIIALGRVERASSMGIELKSVAFY